MIDLLNSRLRIEPAFVRGKFRRQRVVLSYHGQTFPPFILPAGAPYLAPVNFNAVATVI